MKSHTKKAASLPDAEIDYQYTKSNSDSSDDEENIWSSKLTLRRKINDSPESQPKQPTEMRIEFVTKLLQNIDFKPIIDFDPSQQPSRSNLGLFKKILDAEKIFRNMQVRLQFIKGGTTGQTFKATSIRDPDVHFAIKFCAFPKDGYGAICNPSRPENTEIRMLKLLSELVVKRNTPHLVLPIYTFNTDINNFIRIRENSNSEIKNNDKTYNSFVKNYYRGRFQSFVSVLIVEWCNGGDLLDYIRHNYQTMTCEIWSNIFFQIVYTLARIHKRYPNFRHNDLKANNILIQKTHQDTTTASTHSMSAYGSVSNSKTENTYLYKIDDMEFRVPNIGFQIKIWDFDFSCIGGYVGNNKVNADWCRDINITSEKNQYYDIHYFLNTLSSKRFFKKFFTTTPPEIVDFVKRVVPERYRSGCVGAKVNEKGRIRVNTEFTTPYDILKKDVLFNGYRV